MDLKNKVAVVTGSASGIGKAIAIVLAGRGAKLVVNSRKNVDGGKAVANTITSAGGLAIFVKANLSDEKETSVLFSQAVQKFGTVDILINNAGQSKPGELDNIDIWKYEFENVLLSQVIATSHFLKIKQQGLRKIINISSIYGSSSGSNLSYIAYGAAKAGVNNFTVNLAKKLGGNVLVNAIAPGWTWTPPWGDDRSVEEKNIKDKAVIARFIEPEEIAQTVVMVLENDAITGQVITVDGGATLKDLY